MECRRNQEALILSALKTTVLIRVICVICGSKFFLPQQPDNPHTHQNFPPTKEETAQTGKRASKSQPKVAISDDDSCDPAGRKLPPQSTTTQVIYLLWMFPMDRLGFFNAISHLSHILTLPHIK